MNQRTAYIKHPYKDFSLRQVVPWDKTLKEAKYATEKMIAKPAQGGVEAKKDLIRLGWIQELVG